MTETLTEHGRTVLTGIAPRAWEHPADRAALAALRKLPGFDLVLRKLFGVVGERSLRLFHQANAVQVGEYQFGRVHERFMECCAVLDIEEIPELYVAQTPLLNARTIGLDRPFIVFHSSSLEILDDDELHFVLGHELGHMMSGHALYKTMLGLLIQLSIVRLGLPLTQIPLVTLIMALREWDRKSELSADRAGLLAVQDPEAGFRAHMKMAGGTRVDQMNLEAFKSQARAYEAEGTVTDSLFKVLNSRFASHPFAVSRLAEALRFVEGGEYDAILSGSYPRDGGDEPVRADVGTAIAAYRENLAESDDPLAKILAEWSDRAGEAATSAKERFRRPKPSDGLEDYAWTGFDEDLFED